MREFFKGWRRKAGLVTLAMALVLTAAWMRSRLVFDALSITVRHTQHNILSIRDGIVWRAWERRDEKANYEWIVGATSEWDLIPITGDSPLEFAILAIQIPQWTIPYWSLVLPLTLLSAWLILGKRQKPKDGTP